MTTKPKSVHMQKLSRYVLVSLLVLIPAVVLAATTKYNFANPVVTSSTEAPGTWYPDRYAPCGFVSPVTAPDLTKHTLEETICLSDWQTPTPNFYNTQGRKYDLPAKTYSLTTSVYVPSSWATTNGRMAGLWATALDSTGAIEAYPIIEFQGHITSDANGPGYYPNGGAGFYGWDTTNGGFTLIPFPTGFKYNTWVKLTITLLSGSGYTYTVANASGGAGVTQTVADLSGASLANVILQGYNYDYTYNIFWNGMTSTASH